jgi:hypothetical protein
VFDPATGVNRRVDQLGAGVRLAGAHVSLALTGR